TRRATRARPDCFSIPHCAARARRQAEYLLEGTEIRHVDGAIAVHVELTVVRRLARAEEALLEHREIAVVHEARVVEVAIAGVAVVIAVAVTLRRVRDQRAVVLAVANAVAVAVYEHQRSHGERVLGRRGVRRLHRVEDAVADLAV